MSTYCKLRHLAPFFLGVLVAAVLQSPAVASAKTLEAKLQFEGKVYYRIIREINNRFQGDMTSVVVTAEESVTKGQVLGTYVLKQGPRNRLLQRISKVAIENKEFQIEESTTKLQMEEKKLANIQRLYLEGMQSKLQLDSARELMEQHRKRLNFDKRQLEKQKKKLAEEKKLISIDLGGVSLATGEIPESIPLVSPIDGHVLDWRDTKLWENMPQGTACFKVANIKNITVKARVFVEDYPKLAVGMKAEVTSTAYPGKTFHATLSKMPLTPIDKGYAALSYYLVEFEMDNSKLLFREGNSVTVKLPPQTVKSTANQPANQTENDVKDKPADN